MKKRLTILMIAILAVGMLNFGCKKDKDDSNSALPKEVTNFVPESTLNEIKRLGMPINEGNTPPIIENSFLAKPFILKASNRPNDVAAGSQFYNYRVKFYEQNNAKRTIKCDYTNGSEVGTGLGSYVSGSGNSFTVFSEMDIVLNTDKAKIVQVISGTLVEGGIKGFYYANFMIDNYGNPNLTLLENGQGRVIYDSDGMSEKVTKSAFIGEEALINKTVNSILK